MTAARWIAVAAMVAAGLGADAAEAKPRKPMSGTYNLFLPVPWVVEGSGGSHCERAPEGPSKSTRQMNLPAAGKLTVELTGTIGDWVIEIRDAKGHLVSTGTADLTATTRRATYKNKKAQKVSVVVCNYAGGPEGVVHWIYTFS